MKELTKYQLQSRRDYLSACFQELMNSLRSATYKSRLLAKRIDNIGRILQDKYYG